MTTRTTPRTILIAVTTAALILSGTALPVTAVAATPAPHASSPPGESSRAASTSPTGGTDPTPTATPSAPTATPSAPAAPAATPSPTATPSAPAAPAAPAATPSPITTPSAAPRAAATPAPTPTPTPAPTPSFAWPLTKKTYVVSSFMGPRCMPLPGASTSHQGIDLAAPSGAPIYAIAAGTVTATVNGTTSRAGYVAIRHVIEGVTYTSYSYHVWSATTHVTVGQKVKAGQRITQVGNSGGSTGAHLHLELRRSGATAATDPAPFLKSRGIDLLGGAKSVTAKKAPATCTYYATTAVNFRRGPSTSHAIIRTVPKGTAMIHVPGRITSGFLPVTIGGASGWISSSYATPVKPAAPTPTYVTTAALNLRASASTSSSVLLVIPKGKSVGTIKGTSGVWRKVTYAGKTGWVHSTYLKRR